MKKKLIKEVLNSNILNSIDGMSLDNFSSFFTSHNKSSIYKNVKLFVRYHWEYTELQIIGERLETDTEFKKRKERSERAKIGAKRRVEKKRLKELKELERLQKKYGKGE